MSAEIENVYEQVLTPTSGLRLHLNENTAGCSPKVLEALAGLSRQDIAFYPGYADAVSACAKRLGVETDELVLTNGLDEGILALTIAALRTRDVGVPEAIIVSPTFDMYAATADAVGAKVVDVPVGEDFSLPTERILAAITSNTRLLFLTSPNNPTGLSIAPDDVLRIASAAPHVRVLVDEAYIDFGGVTLVGQTDAKALPNLFIGRTFAKAYGLAGLRAGAVIGYRDAIALLRHIVPPFSLNVAATVALIAGLSDNEYYDWYLGQVRASKLLLYDSLSRAKVPFWKSDANFVLARFDARANAVVAGLAARGVHVRDKSRDPACPGCVRITTGVVAHTEACIRALEEVLCGEA
jgi:histidinol-phosphate aminotransferase